MRAKVIKTATNLCHFVTLSHRKDATNGRFGKMTGTKTLWHVLCFIFCDGDNATKNKTENNK